MRIENIIRSKLQDVLDPIKLDIKNKSYLHVGHTGNFDRNCDTHFHLNIVSPRLHGLTRLNQQRYIYQILSKEMEESIHALTIKVIDT